MNTTDIERRRKEVELNKLYREGAYLTHFPPTEREFYSLDILTKCLLGIKENVRYQDGILNEDCLVNLKKSKEVDMTDVDVGDELKELLKIYSEYNQHLTNKHGNSLEILTNYMKHFIEIDEERKKVANRLQTIKEKICKLTKEDEE